MDAWEREVNPNEAPMSKSERWALRTFVTDPKYSNWHVILPGPQRRRLNAPGAIINAYNRAFPDLNKPKKERKVSDALSPALTTKNKEIEQLKARTVELEEELAAAREPAAKDEAAPSDRTQFATQTVDLDELRRKLGPILKALQTEGAKKHAALIAPILIQTIANDLQRCLNEWTLPKEQWQMEPDPRGSGAFRMTTTQKKKLKEARELKTKPGALRDA
jgi:hypothetical protein